MATDAQLKQVEPLWLEIPIFCKCKSGWMVSDGKSLPWCPNCLTQMTLHDLLQVLISPEYECDPEVEAEEKALHALGWSLS